MPRLRAEGPWNQCFAFPVFHRVLACVAEGTTSDNVLRRATKIAQRFDSYLLILHALPAVFTAGSAWEESAATRSLDFVRMMCARRRVRISRIVMRAKRDAANRSPTCSMSRWGLRRATCSSACTWCPGKRASQEVRPRRARASALFAAPLPDLDAGGASTSHRPHPRAHRTLRSERALARSSLHARPRLRRARSRA